MKHEKTFAAIEKLKDVELELHRLKNALELANKALDAQPAQESEPDELAIAYMSGLLDGKKHAELIRADERERIKAANEPEIERINAYLKNLEDADKAEREACMELCKVEIERIKPLHSPTADNCLRAIRARGNT